MVVQGEMTMSSPEIAIQGVYRVPVTDELFAQAMALKYGGLDLPARARKEAEESVREELSSVVLVDAVVSHGGQEFNPISFGQAHMDQVAYDEAYLSLDDSQIVSRLDCPSGDVCRIAFFLHFYDPQRSLETPFGDVSAPEPQDMPEELAQLLPYDPVG